MMQGYSHHYRDMGQKAKPKPAMISIKLVEYNELKARSAALAEIVKLAVDAAKS